MLYLVISLLFLLCFVLALQLQGIKVYLLVDNGPEWNSIIAVSTSKKRLEKLKDEVIRQNEEYNKADIQREKEWEYFLNCRGYYNETCVYEGLDINNLKCIWDSPYINNIRRSLEEDFDKKFPTVEYPKYHLTMYGMSKLEIECWSLI